MFYEIFTYTDNCPCPSSPANGYVTGCSETSSVGYYVYYYCNSGYLMTSGDSPRKCTIGGNWTGREPVCEIGVCVCVFACESLCVFVCMFVFPACSMCPCVYVCIVFLYSELVELAFITYTG